MTYPTSPADEMLGRRASPARRTRAPRRRTPSPCAIAFTFSRGWNEPSTTRTKATTPRYWSYDESKMSARAGASGSPRGGGTRSTTAWRTRLDAGARLRRDADDVVGRPAHQVGDLGRHAVGVGRRQVDLVHDRHDLELVLDREVGVGERLRLDALGRVDHEDRALARGQAAAHLVAEVDMAGRVDQVQLVGPLVGRAEEHPHRLGLDRDAPLALEIHRVEELVAHLALGDRLGHLEDAIGQRRLAVVDVGDDREVADP